MGGPVGLEVEVEAGEAGFDAGRLARIDRHFARYVDDGRLPGWLVLVSRHGKVVHLATCGQRDLEAGLPVEAGTRFRIYSMTKPVTAVAAMQLYEEGAFALKDPVHRFIPSFERPGRLPRRPGVGPADRAGHPAGAALAPAHPHRRPDLRVPPRPPGRRHVPGGRVRVGGPRRPRPGRVLRPLGRAAAAVRAGQRVELLGGQRRPRPGGRGGQRPAAGPVLPGADLRAAGHDRHRLLGRGGGRRRAGRPLQRRPGRAGRSATTTLGGRALRRPACLAGGGGLVSTAADYHRFTQALLGGGELDGARLLGSRTLAYMARNHLPGGADLESFGRRLFAETTFDGVGYGLGLGRPARPGGQQGPLQPRASSPGAAPPAPSSGSTRPSG